MIRSVLKYSILVYLALGCIGLAVMVRRSQFLVGLIWLLILIVIIVVVGLVFGMIISVLFRKPHHERKFYLIGQFAALVLIASFFIDTLTEGGGPKRSNAEENEITIRDVTDATSRQFVVPAFDSLKLKFKSPNDLELNSVTSFENKDGFTVYFAYKLAANDGKEYYSKYKVENGEARLIQFNLDTRSTIEYLRVIKQQKALKDTLKKYEKLIK